MRTKSDTQVLQEYDDLIDGTPATARVLRALDAGYGSAPLPPSLRELKLPVRTASRPSRSGGWRRRWKISAPIALLAGVAVVVAGSLAAGKSPNITDLGKPTNAYGASGYNVLDNFHKIKQSLRVGRKPEFLLIDALNYGAPGTTDAIRWPIVKALDQFGALTHVRALQAGTYPPNYACRDRVDGYFISCSYATFDLTHARYSSRFVSFVSRDILVLGSKDKNASNWTVQRNQPLKGRDLAFFRRYRRPQGPENPGGAWGTAPQLPMLVVRNYLETSTSFISGAELVATPPGAPTAVCPGQGCTPTTQTEPLSFSAVRDSLVRDKNPPGNKNLVLDVNAEANVLTALICHADGKKPASVCGRPVIKKLMKLAK